MAELIINDCDITVSLSAVEKLEALHGNVTVSRSAVARVRTVPDGMVEVHGLRAPGTGLPGVIKVGTWRSREGKTFAVCHGRRPAIVLDLVGAPYNTTGTLVGATCGDAVSGRKSTRSRPANSA